jgi:hypothetical protein
MKKNQKQTLTFEDTTPASTMSYVKVVSESSEIKEKTNENRVVATPFVVNSKSTLVNVSNLVPATSSVPTFIEAQTNENAGKTTNETSNLKRISNEIPLNTEIHSVVDDIEMKEIESSLNEISPKDDKETIVSNIDISSTFKVEDEFMEIWMNATKTFKDLIVKRQLSPFIVLFCNFDDIAKEFEKFEILPFKKFMKNNEQHVKTCCKVSRERMASVIEKICETKCSFKELLLIVTNEVKKQTFHKRLKYLSFLHLFLSLMCMNISKNWNFQKQIFN